MSSLQAEVGVTNVLRGAVECACLATGSPRGRAGMFDGEAATSDEWYDERRGWTPERLRWKSGQGAPGRACRSGAPVTACRQDAGGAEPAPDAFRGQAGICAPLTSAGVVVGFLWVIGRRDGYDDEGADLLQAIARLAAERLKAVADTERRLAEAQAQAGASEQLQRQLLPGDPPQIEGLDIAFAYRSASVGVLGGGDFVDYYTRPPSDSLAFAIGDVAGKGAEAMAHTFVAKFILRAAVHGGQLSWPTSPGAALQELRTGLLEQPGFGEDSERFVTVLFGLISPRRGLLQLSSAGHPAPFIVREDGVERPLLFTEPAIGVELGAALEPYPTETIAVRRGDVVVMFTDGIAELRDDADSFFEDQMASVLQGCHGCRAATAVDALLQASEAFSARPPADDLALLCIRLRRDPVN